MKIVPLIFSLLALVFCASCTQAPNKITASQAQQLAQESSNAMNAKDYGRAQTLAAEATRIDPKFAEAWVGYGMASVRLGQTDQAKLAYERALSLHQAKYRQNPTDANQVCQQIFLLGLLGRPVEAETLLARARTNHPNDRQVIGLAEHFSETKQGWVTWMVEPR